MDTYRIENCEPFTWNCLNERAIFLFPPDSINEGYIYLILNINT
jgi:hypothetical protein